MTPHYLVGVVCGIIGGLLNQGGQLLQKKVVNDIRFDNPSQGFMRRLLRSPLWVGGFVIGLCGGTAGYMVAQSLIGPALSSRADGLRVDTAFDWFGQAQPRRIEPG